MDRALVERLRMDIRDCLRSATDGTKPLEVCRKLIETAAGYVDWLRRIGYKPSENELADCEGAAQFVGYSEEEARGLFQHKKNKRNSTKQPHEEGISRLNRDRDKKEKADERRRKGRRRPKGWRGKWPSDPTPVEPDEEQENEEEEPEEDMGATVTPEDQYQEALNLAREAKRKGGPPPVSLVKLLKESADADYIPAVYALATWHLFGYGVKKDYKRAASLLRKAADKRHPTAEYDLAVCYEIGKGVPKSEKSAWLYYLKAATDGDIDGMAETARCFYHGIGTEQDRDKAAEFYLKAAKKGHAEAQYEIARAYETGEGRKKNRRCALEWYEKAAAQGDEDAKAAAADLRKQLGD